MHMPGWKYILQSADLSSAKNKVGKAIKKAAGQTVLILLGIFALMIIVLVAGFSIAEIIRIMIQWRDGRRYEEAPWTGKRQRY